jgi:hypothetical protein
MYFISIKSQIHAEVTNKLPVGSKQSLAYSSTKKMTLGIQAEPNRQLRIDKATHIPKFPSNQFFTPSHTQSYSRPR